jgi:hypothetical protein
MADERDQRGVRARFVVAIRDDHQHSGVANAPHEQTDDVERGGIGPVRVLDDDDGRATSVHHVDQGGGERDVISRVALEEIGRAHRSRKRTHRCQRHRNRQRLAANNNENSRVADALQKTPDQRALAAARLATDEHQRTATRKRLLERGAEDRKLVLALQQPLHQPIVDPPGRASA